MQTSYDPARSRWRVTYQVNGRQHCRFFQTRTAANAFAANRRADVRQFGVPWASLTALQRADIQVRLDRLKRAGWTLRAATGFKLEHGKAPPALPLQALAAQCLRAREAKGCRPRSLRKFRKTIDRFLIGRRDRPASETVSAEVHEFLTCNGWRPATARSFLIDRRTLFVWGVRNKLCRENPALAAELPRPEDTPPGILTPTQSAELVFRCQEAEPALLTTLVLCLFAGVRPEEARRLAGLFKDWLHDAMRHSFASYHLVKHRNENHTAHEMGNSPQMIFAHYRELVRPADAEAFFGIVPRDCPAPGATAFPGATDPQGDAIGLNMGQDRCPSTPAKPVKAPPSSRRVTAEILGAIFHHGARSMTKPEAVTALSDEYGFAPSTTFLALAGTGRFRAHLRECDGKLSWTPFPLADAAEPPLPPLPPAAQAA